MVLVTWVIQLLLRLLFSLCLQRSSNSFTRYKSTRVDLPFCLSWCLVPAPFPPQPYSDFKILLPKVFEWRAVLAVSFGLEKSPWSLSVVSYIYFNRFFSSPMKTWSSWYPTSLRKVYAFLQGNRFFRTLAKSSVHYLDASPSLQNYAKNSKKRTQA